jgi:hypothetical protein
MDTAINKINSQMAADLDIKADLIQPLVEPDVHISVPLHEYHCANLHEKNRLSKMAEITRIESGPIYIRYDTRFIDWYRYSRGCACGGQYPAYYCFRRYVDER